MRHYLAIFTVLLCLYSAITHFDQVMEKVSAFQKIERLLNDPDAAVASEDEDNTPQQERKPLLIHFKSIVIEMPKHCIIIDTDFGAPKASITLECDAKKVTRTFDVNPEIKSVSFIRNEHAESISITGRGLVDNK